jgi:hypothetical protein
MLALEVVVLEVGDSLLATDECPRWLLASLVPEVSTGKN